MPILLPLSVGYALDVLLFCIFCRTYPVRKSRLTVLLTVILLFYSVYRLFFGHSAVAGSLQDMIVLFSEIGICYLALLSLFGVHGKTGFAESTMFILALNVGRKLFFHMEFSFLPAMITGSPLFCQLLAGVNKLVLVMLVCPHSREEYEGNVSVQELFLLLFALFNCSILSMLNVTAEDNSRLLNLDMVCYLSAFVCALAVKQFARMNGRMKEAEQIQTDMKLQYELYTRQRDNDEAVRRMYHDLKHQLKAIEGTGGSAAALAQSMTRQLESMHSMIYTRNAILNAVLNEEQRKAEALGISFTLESGLGPFGFMDDYDLVSLFSNALDNAVEAASACPEDRRRILLRYTEKPAYLLLIIENTFEGARREDGGLLLTTKPDREMHGIGVKSIRYAAGKYDGTCSYEMKDGVFSLRILIPVPQAK